MNLEFTVNEYILIWNLLFKKSVSKELNEKKQKIWRNYKKEYNELQNERENILLDQKNYIPNDDTIYNLVKEEEMYQEFYDFTMNYKQELSKTYAYYKKKLIKEFLHITHLNIPEYTILIVDPRLNFIDYIEDDNSKIICYARNNATIENIIDIFYNIMYKETTNHFSKKNIDKKIIDIVLEIAIYNELMMKITDRDYRQETLCDDIKSDIYQYFLEYLTRSKADYLFKKMNLYDFIEFCNDKFGSKEEIITIEELT